MVARKDAEEAEPKAEEEKKDADGGAMLDKLLACLDGLNAKFDSVSSRLDAYESEMMDKHKKDAAVKEVKEEGDPKEMEADSHKKDSVRADADFDMAELLAFAEKRGIDVARQANLRSLKEDSLASIQMDSDVVFSSHGLKTPHPWPNEGASDYRRRLATAMKQHSPLWKSVELRELSGQALANACTQVFKDAAAAVTNNESYGETLREVRSRNPDTGHLIKRYYGDPQIWLRNFASPARRAKFRLPSLAVIAINMNSARRLNRRDGADE